MSSLQKVEMRPRARHSDALDAFRPPALKTKFHDNPVLANLETQAIKDGHEYMELETDSGQKFEGYTNEVNEQIVCGKIVRPDGDKLGFTY